MIAQWFGRLFPPERRKRLLVMALLLVPLAILTLLFKEIARTIIVQPVMYLLWLVGLLWRSIPQVILWIILVVVVLRVAVGSLLARRRRRDERLRAAGPEHWGRSRIWTRWVELAEQGGYYQRRLSRYLTDLTLDALAQREYLSRDLVEEELAAGRLDVPASIRAFLLAVLNEPPPGRLTWLKRFLRKQPSAPQINPQEILDYLEAQTGVGYGR
jgi:hypothetical protein